MLSLDIYKSLPIEDKTHYLWYRGQFLGSRVQGNHKVELYSLFNFYVEIWYTAFDYWAKDSMIIRVDPFCNLQFLDPYLENVRFEILNC